MTDANIQPMVMLVVEDNPGDVILLQEALRELGAVVSMTVLTNGLSATEHLRQVAESGAGFPEVVVLDLNLPVMSGHEVLREIAADPALRDLPVVILTTSTNDRVLCQEIHACLYLVKPPGFGDMIDTAHRIIDYARSAKAGSSGEERDG